MAFIPMKCKNSGVYQYAFIPMKCKNNWSGVKLRRNGYLIPEFCT